MSERPPHSHEEQPAEAERDVSHEPHPRQLNPRIYVTRGLPMRAELTDGLWLDMAREARDIRAEMFSALHADDAHTGSPLYIWDYRDFGAFNIQTGAIGLEGVDSIDLLAQIARGIREHGPAYAAWAKYNEDDPRLFDQFPAAFLGQHESLAAFMRGQLQQMGYEAVLDQAMPEEIRPFVAIDYQTLANELFGDGIVVIPAEGGVWIFNTRA
ncbi:antirestriction protein ArdA [Nocardia mangyaensis]|uniref:antirestriction protein ArdA n=1 Tax=Nocardia mangyaensis TaxID=2213200 RepID=UPI002674E3D6|nr:antirestriction protein ArdA [Nocardia mangyaensis]MDO3645658.1 antirestriction protein ArdA [Nocardia mangyaensis]